jgi:hypothetical protein
VRQVRIWKEESISYFQLLLYGSQSWTLRKAHEEFLGDFERKILRRLYGEA